MSEFETIRTGSPAQQTAARRALARSIRTASAGRIARNAPARNCLITIGPANSAALHTGATTPTDLA